MVALVAGLPHRNGSMTQLHLFNLGLFPYKSLLVNQRSPFGLSLNPQQSDMPYYTPPNVFRQPAIVARNSKSPEPPQLDTHRRSWQNDTSRLKSPLLRKASGDMNDYFTTQQLQSEFWALPQSCDSPNFYTSLSSAEDVILASNTATGENLKMYTLKAKNQTTAQLAELQTISVPGKPITTSRILPQSSSAAKQPTEHNRLLCTGHQDGIVNLISTSETQGGAKIIKRFNHAKYLKSTKPDCLDEWLQQKRASPVRQINDWNKMGFISVINESLFIYDFNQHKLPIFLQSFTGLEAVEVNAENPNILSLVGSNFGDSGLSLLDLRCGGGQGKQYSPDVSTNTTVNISSACAWLDEYTVANAIGNSVKLWDIRSSGVKCTVEGHKGSIKALKYHHDTQRLYTSDDQNYTIAWDMGDLTNVSECHLATGFQSICEDNISHVKQCGNVVLSPNTSPSSFKPDVPGSGVSGFTFLQTYHDGSLLTLDSRELGLHTIKSVERPFLPPRNPLRLQRKPEVDVLESDSTMNQESIISSWDNVSEGTIEGEELTTPAKNQPLSPVMISENTHKTHNPSIYSLKDFDLSGSTIYNERIIHEDVLL